MSLTPITFTGNNYWTIDNGADLALGSGDFTIEWFQNMTTSTSFPRIFAVGSYPAQNIGVSIEGGSFYFWGSSANFVTSLQNYIGQWVHFAIVRIDGVIQIFQNGVQIGSNISNNTNFSDTNTVFALGNETNPSYGAGFIGQMTNFRIIKGSGIYNESSTFPDNHLQSLSDNNGTTVLLNMNGGVLTNYGSYTGAVNPLTIGGGGGGGPPPQNYDDPTVPCFVAGTRIMTPTGEKLVEKLSSGDKVLTADGRVVEAVIYHSKSKKAPYMIPAGTFSRDCPKNDITLSARHAIAVKKNVWEIPEFAAARYSSIKKMAVSDAIDYFHVELPNYFTDNLIANGNVVESFGANAIAAVPKGEALYKYSSAAGGFLRYQRVAPRTTLSN